TIRSYTEVFSVRGSTPKPEVALPCGSKSHNSMRLPRSYSAAARLIAVVVLPTPPFWLANAMIFPITVPSYLFVFPTGFIIAHPCGIAKAHGQFFQMFHVKHKKGTAGWQLLGHLFLFHVKQFA